MNIKIIDAGMPVLYIPTHLLKSGNRSSWFKDENLGIVTSKNEHYVFVKYKGKEHSEATNAEDLYWLINRPDLVERLGIEIKPINRIYELYLNEKEMFNKEISKTTL